jgi:hypothetical protein
MQYQVIINVCQLRYRSLRYHSCGNGADDYVTDGLYDGDCFLYLCINRNIQVSCDYTTCFGWPAILQVDLGSLHQPTSYMLYDQGN